MELKTTVVQLETSGGNLTVECIDQVEDRKAEELDHKSKVYGGKTKDTSGLQLTSQLKLEPQKNLKQCTPILRL